MSERKTDLQVYRWLLRLVDEADSLAKRCWSLASSTALRLVSQMLRSVASALFTASLDETAR